MKNILKECYDYPDRFKLLIDGPLVGLTHSSVKENSEKFKRLFLGDEIIYTLRKEGVIENLYVKIV